MHAVVNVKLCGLLARLAGHCATRVVKVSEQTTVYDVLVALAEQYGPALCRRCLLFARHATGPAARLP
ncbi:MAG: hypothetical protein KatS3mg131_2697 [Candidatus Tectimicrobiota bacterium]|nr:MAG: hypothetical protein KatS3mg131_2697 [Candidatus Tectomicrobia bacterium]